MTSYGESDLQVSASIVGQIRAIGIAADPAIFPRLAVTLGVTLHDRVDERSPIPPPGKFELRDATGELRLSEHSDAIGAVVWAGHRRFVRSSNYGAESQLRFVCDLDHQRLEAIESRRAGGTLKLWLQIWPVLVAGTQFLDGDVGVLQLTVPRDAWLGFYTQVGGGQFDLIEIQYSSREAEQFKRAVTRVQEARARIVNGDYDGAIALCRNAIEALQHELDLQDDTPTQALLERRTDARRAAEYAGIISRIKRLTNFAHHELGNPMTFSRAEAQFIVRCTESVLALLGRLTQPDP